MNPSAVALAILLSTSAILSATMGVAWAHFGRQRHALTLAFAYGSGLVHWSIDAIGLLWFPGNPAIIGTATVFTIITSTLVAMRSEEHTSELQSLMRTSYAVFCLQKKTTRTTYKQ